MARRSRSRGGGIRVFENIKAELKARLPGAAQREADARAAQALRTSSGVAAEQSKVGDVVPKTDKQRQDEADAKLAAQMAVRQRQSDTKVLEQVNAQTSASPDQAPGRNLFQGLAFMEKKIIRPEKPVRAGRRKSRKLGNKFNRCVKSVRSTVKARKGSTKESAAIAICTTSVLYPRGRTMKRYRKGRLVTQKRKI